MHPSKGYLLLCLAENPNMKYKGAQEILGNYGLFADSLTQDNWSDLVEEFRKTERPDYYLPGSSTEEGMLYEMSLGIFEGCNRTDRYQNALKILGYPSLREKVERLLFSRMPPDEIARTINTLLGNRAHYVKEDIDTYYHYFCCVEVWSTGEWRRALLDRGFGWGSAVEDVRLGNPDVARFRIGRQMTIQAEELLDEVMAHTFTRLRVLRMQPTTKEVINQTATMSKIGLQAYELASSSTRQLEDVYAQLRGIAQTRKDTTTPSINDLLLEEGAEMAAPRQVSVEDEYREGADDVIDAVFTDTLG